MAQKSATKKVSNRNNYKVEVFSLGKVFVFPPKATITVPEEVNIPTGLGLVIRK